jgi:hydrogen cyanide synthase HcnC
MASNARFRALAETIQEVSGVDIEYRPNAGLLFVMYGENERRFAERVVHSLPREERPEILTPEEALRVEPNMTPDQLGSVFLEGEYQVNPMLLSEGFKRVAVQLGARMRSDAHVTRIRRQGNRCVGVEIGDEFLPCGTVVNAAGSWAGSLATGMGVALPVSPVRGQVVLTETLPATLAAGLSTSSCYMLQKAHGEVLIGSTTERVGFDTSVTESAIQGLCHGAVRAVPLLAEVRVRRVWAGLRPGTPDELPILGSVDGLEGYQNAAGGFRTGIVASPLVGELAAQSCQGEDTTLPLEPYRVKRFSEQSASQSRAQSA